MIFATWSLGTNNFEWAVFAINSGPVVIDTLFISFTNFYDGRSIVPIMVLAGRTVLANNFFVLAILSEFLHVF